MQCYCVSIALKPAGERQLLSQVLVKPLGLYSERESWLVKKNKYILIAKHKTILMVVFIFLFIYS